MPAVFRSRRAPRFTTLLAASLVGVYLLVVAGATAALAAAAAACPGWPLCAFRADPAVAIALGHRAVAALVGVSLLVTAAVGWHRADRRVGFALAVALVLFPVQVALGAGVAGGAEGLLPGVHLALAMVIFGAVALALAWQLEVETGTDDDPIDDPDALAPPPVDAGEVRSPTLPSTPLARARAVVGAYLRLTKPRLMWLLCLVAGAGMALAAGPALRLETVLYTLGGGVLAIGASGTFNHVLERDVDRRMQRTADRPLATDVVSVPNALAFGVALAVGSLVLFWQVNALAAALGLVAIGFYSVVYTLVLKPNTVQNTVIGGAAGALPALIGWAAVTGRVGVPGAALAAVVFLWTPAHFYNLALAYKEDYARGGFPMLPVVRGETVTRKHVLYYLAATLLGAAALTALSDLGWLYAATTVTLGAVFLAAVVRLHRERTDAAAFRAFHASNAYLGGLLVAVVLDAVVV
jgi:protoheme IX farnesyltransferase